MDRRAQPKSLTARSVVDQQGAGSEGHISDLTVSPVKETVNAEQTQNVAQEYEDPDDRGFRRIIRNFTPSYVHLYLGVLLAAGLRGRFGSHPGTDGSLST